MGGWKYRDGIPMTDRQVEENAATIPGEFKGLAIEVFIGRVRKKIGPDRIETARGLGYRLTPLEGEATG
jgi:DNA-binding response OmpR family regulator